MAYNEKNLSFGPQYIIPKPMDPRLALWSAVYHLERWNIIVHSL